MMERIRSSHAARAASEVARVVEGGGHAAPAATLRYGLEREHECGSMVDDGVDTLVEAGVERCRVIRITGPCTEPIAGADRGLLEDGGSASMGGTLVDRGEGVGVDEGTVPSCLLVRGFDVGTLGPHELGGEREAEVVERAWVVPRQERG